MENIIRFEYNKGTKEEIENLLCRFRKDFSLHRGIQISDHDIREWCNKNL
jgi:hypothetical protein